MHFPGSKFHALISKTKHSLVVPSASAAKPDSFVQASLRRRQASLHIRAFRIAIPAT